MCSISAYRGSIMNHKLTFPQYYRQKLVTTYNAHLMTPQVVTFTQI